MILCRSSSTENIQNNDVENNISTKNNDSTNDKINDNNLSNFNSFEKLPNTIDEFTQAIQDLYLDTLYTTNVIIFIF